MTCMNITFITSINYRKDDSLLKMDTLGNDLILNISFTE